MRSINLTNSDCVVLIDDEDFDHISAHNWYMNSCGYAYRSYRPAGGKKKQSLMLHRAILGGEREIDHINRDKMDNRRANLRFVTRGQNNQNRSIRGKLKGIKKEHNRWRARIGVDKRSINLGAFATQTEAALAYNAAAIKHYGPSAYQNVIS